MIRLLIVLALLFAQEPPRLYVVASRDVVYPGQLVSVTVTAFGVTEPIQFDAGGLEVVSQEQGERTLYVTMKAGGVPRDVTITARAGALSASTLVRVCCVKAPDAVNPARRLYFPAFRA